MGFLLGSPLSSVVLHPPFVQALTVCDSVVLGLGRVFERLAVGLGYPGSGVFGITCPKPR